MTKEEAIHFATCLKNNWTINFADMEDFCDMAIEALQSLSKPNNGLQGSDLIRREDIPYVDLNSDMPHSNVRVWIAFKESIDALPSAEAVEVVRCKDCKYQEECEQIVVFDIHVDEVQGHRVDFCSYGERKGGDEYEKCVEQMEHDIMYEPTYNQEDGSM